MLLSRKRRLFVSFWLTVAAVTALPFQNCTQQMNFAGFRVASLSGGNGDGYEGKPTIYEYYSTAVPCAEQNAKGGPLPNHEIFYYNSSNVQKVRQDCADIEPIALIPGEVQMSNAGDSLTFQGLNYVAQDRSEFAVVAAQCPAGMTPKASPVRTNLFPDSQYVVDHGQNSGSWWIQPGLGTSLVGSLASLPSWEIKRVTTDSESWRRASQVMPLTAGKKYSYSVLVRRGTIDQVGVNFWQCGAVYPCAPQMQTYLRFDLSTATYEILDGRGSEADLSATMRPLAGGYLITVYFTPTGSFVTDMGTMPYSSTYLAPQGDSIETTAFQLEDVSTFCE